MDFRDSGELYTVVTQFYTGQHSKVVEYSLNQFSDESQLKLLEFQVRSTVSLGKDASKLIDDGKAQFPDNEPLFSLLSAWNDLHSFGVDDSTYFEDVKEPEFELQAILTSFYIVKFLKNIDGAISLLTKYIDDSNMLKINELEPYLVLIQLHLIQGNFGAANKIFNNFENFPDSAKDSIVYQVLESWVSSIKGETENINNAYYFYDEILSNDFENDESGKFKILNTLLVLTIKLKHYPEAYELVKQINTLDVKQVDDYLANQITLNYLTGKAENNDELISKLKISNPDHAYLTDRAVKNEKFTDIVNKYKN
ncbi:hypothetical protein PSN45_004913 [Yamadazyma tenuis]|uniref:Coatomer subunit epsilon n=1 Tax=Candida tenuis (strain ATCC 10573 / BCRC 21748 / CBS 615 / JCM 9827 / NBRC 10315 / NRRL Y-1498 / VKM Y-70) TaxID=590646 RepID=G3B235_CANTC|nr:uncharacterized protein CANTEDRAFT_113369 [Yamadazyma tenuis ATCC 10573]EGV64597.1 hypothetical protein CANTEDRAFT_113369 [Yamadazyma tenuis ATCC 10573]WEJ97362.1 hypothetical protein PSN45_004913 [Yamadazyma tenuis]